MTVAILWEKKGMIAELCELLRGTEHNFLDPCPHQPISGLVSLMAPPLQQRQSGKSEEGPALGQPISTGTFAYSLKIITRDREMSP